MPMQSEKQRRYLWATDPELARKYEDKTPKGAKLPEKKERQKRGFVEGYYSVLTKVAANPGLLAKIMADLEKQKIREVYKLPAQTMGQIPDLLPANDAKSATRLKLEILGDPGLTDADKNALLARLEKRPEVSGSRLTDHMLLGAAMPGSTQMAINAYLAAKRNPRASSLLERILRMGMLSSRALTSDHRFIDRRRAPEEERPSQWKITPI